MFLSLFICSFPATRYAFRHIRLFFISTGYMNSPNQGIGCPFGQLRAYGGRRDTQEKGKRAPTRSNRLTEISRVTIRCQYRSYNYDPSYRLIASL